jgi:adenylate cyclase
MAEYELHTFLFADIDGFSIVADESGDEAAAELGLHFLSRAAHIASAHGGEVVKSLGDGVMIHIEGAADSIELALELVAEFESDAALPSIHAGLNTGPAVRRADDWWGATVNVAARVAAAACPGQLLVTEATKLHAGYVASTCWRGFEPLWLKNIRAPVKVYAASRVAIRLPGRGLVQPVDSALWTGQVVPA